MKESENFAARLAVAPMMDWTDRHCRFFHRQFSRHALLYTEMVTAAALVRGGAAHLLDHHPGEHPVALQLGGSSPAELALAARMGAEAGFLEVNLNVGCPSDRVQSGTFGAVLMTQPALVGECVAAMDAAAPAAEITVKCRLGVDDQDPREALPTLVAAVSEAGAKRIIIHARKAWLQGLSPKQNRDVPPLDHGLVHELKRVYPHLAICLNGGIGGLEDAMAHLRAGLDGIMVGRAAYQRPADLLGRADALVFGDDATWAGVADPASDVARRMVPYIDRHVAAGGRAHDVTRHMLGLFAGRPGARSWRRWLSGSATDPVVGGAIVNDALAAMPLREKAA